MDGDTARRVLRARKTLLEMLTARGFDQLSDTALPSETQERLLELCEEHGGALPDLIATRASDGERIGVGFAVDECAGNSVRIAPVRKFAGRLKDNALTRGILVLRFPLTSYAKREVREGGGGGGEDEEGIDEPHIECFTLTQLHFNIMKHELQPKFEVVPPAQVAKLRLRMDDMCTLNATDPVACFLGLEVGQVVRITRTHPAAGYEEVYRAVRGGDGSALTAAAS
jgi:DNA-directed RNA polymerase subunit H (RpoH/RPB5)